MISKCVMSFTDYWLCAYSRKQSLTAHVITYIKLIVSTNRKIPNIGLGLIEFLSSFWGPYIRDLTVFDFHRLKSS